MCGRYQLVLPAEALRQLFALEEPLSPFPPRYNIAPTQPVHVVRVTPSGKRAADLMRWGFVPAWVKEPASFRLLINARSESVADKPAFRNAIRRRRALLPATGFYDWAAGPHGKVPHLFEGEGAMALAGVFETWSGPNGEEVDTVAILTAPATGELAALHDRMPLIVPPEAFAGWLDPRQDDAAAALALTEQADFTRRPVSIRLNNAKNEGAALMEPDPPAEARPPEARDPADAAHETEQLRLL